MCDSPLFREVLRYAYHPQKKYYIPMQYIVTAPLFKGDSHLSAIFPLLDHLHNRHISGQIALKEVLTMRASLSPANAVVFDRVLSRDLRCGIGIRSINTAWTGFLDKHEVMKGIHSDIELIELPMWSSPKIDGLRADYKEGRLISTTGRTFMGVDHIVKQMQTNNVKHLTGELFIPGVPFNTASGLLRSHKECPQAVFAIIDAPECPSELLGERLVWAKQYAGNSIWLIPHKVVRTKTEVLTEYVEALEAGYEGLVLKTIKHKYVPRRTNSWIKLKPSITLDGVITDLEEGTGKYEGSLGAMIVQHGSADGKIMRTTKVGSGFPDKLRQEIWNNFKDYLYRWIEFKGMEYNSEGAVRHPVFVRFREDLDV